ncbi:mpv17-like protein [Helicoverpa zea]|uniref:mpv17-like protein n=1 Tax=Helicoverpa zea TaxID=7113 RepID=UPI001F574AEF|nr:mpv17-like protein [Helicoverpa zea]XP_047027081.1 mpv17-like protein [Helicoverpa zea]XP_047027082.1 mpv17-like protein [Helicoverpa zea]XP_047027083.1 mpv17-like protein [Helicoverpa zea]
MLSTLRRAFQQSLKKRPLLTNLTVYMTFYSAAEFTQQTFNKMYLPEKPDYNLVSGARVVIVGSCLYAPTLYYWYKLLDRKFVGTAAKTVLTKVACDQFIMTPTLLALFFTILSILEGKADIFEELRQKYVKAFIANQSFWIPVQTVNFSLIPSHLRVTYVASASFIWINVLCYIKRQQLGSTKSIE